MKEALSNRQIFFLLVICVIVHDSMEIAKDMVEAVGGSGWISILLGVCVTIFFTYIITYVAFTFKGKTIEEYSEILLGNFVSYIFIGIYIVVFLLIGSTLPQIGCGFIKLNLLEKTPVWGMTLIMYLVVYYTVSKGLRVIGRLFEILGFFIVLILIFIYVIMLSQGQLINIGPQLGSVEIIEYLKSMKDIIPYIGIELLLIVPLQRNNNTRVFRSTIGAVLMIGVIFLLVFFSCTAVLGMDDIIYYKDALFVAVRRVDIEYLEFLTRFDGLFLILWTSALFLKTSIYIYSSTYLTNKIFKKAKFNTIILIICILAYFLQKIPKSFEVTQVFFEFIGDMSILTSYVIPLILFITIKVKKYDKKTF